MTAAEDGGPGKGQKIMVKSIELGTIEENAKGDKLRREQGMRERMVRDGNHKMKEEERMDGWMDGCRREWVNWKSTLTNHYSDHALVKP